MVKNIFMVVWFDENKITQNDSPMDIWSILPQLCRITDDQDVVIAIFI